MIVPHELRFDWIHLAYQERSDFVETYGFSGSQGMINLEGILIRPKGRSSRTLLLFMHPSSTLQLLPLPQEMARSGAHVLCASSRYARNDTAAILEKVVLDLGAYVRHAKDVLHYRNVVLMGWSGGGSLCLFYQSQAERPTLTRTPAGDPIDLPAAGLTPGDAVVFQAAHISRAQLLADVIDPSVRNEEDPDDRDREFDLYDPSNSNRPPYDDAFIVRYRQAQIDRVRRITAWAKDRLAALRSGGSDEVERAFVTHRTFADPRFLDSALDPNDRLPGWSYLGNPKNANTAPIGLARFSTLRAWLSQWSIEDTNADACASASKVSAPLLVIENSADDGVPQPHCRMVFDAATNEDKTFDIVPGANHYYAGQPKQLQVATQIVRNWLSERGL